MIFSMAPTRLKSTERVRECGVRRDGETEGGGEEEGEDEMQRGGKEVEEVGERGETVNSATVWETEGERGGEGERLLLA